MHDPNLSKAKFPKYMFKTATVGRDVMDRQTDTSGRIYHANYKH